MWLLCNTHVCQCSNHRRNKCNIYSTRVKKKNCRPESEARVRLWACGKWLGSGTDKQKTNSTCLSPFCIMFGDLFSYDQCIHPNERGFYDRDSILATCLRCKREANGFWHVVDMAECTAGLNACMLPSQSSNNKCPQSPRRPLSIHMCCS